MASDRKTLIYKDMPNYIVRVPGEIPLQKPKKDSNASSDKHFWHIPVDPAGPEPPTLQLPSPSAIRAAMEGSEKTSKKCFEPHPLIMPQDVAEHNRKIQNAQMDLLFNHTIQIKDGTMKFVRKHGTTEQPAQQQQTDPRKTDQ